MIERDPLLRRVEREAVAACAVMTVAAGVISRAHLAAAAGVVGGGALVWISYRGVKAGIDAMVAAAGPEHLRKRAWIGLVKFFTRYAILAAVAYVIMARLRLPPVAVVAGASSLVVAVAIEALRPRRENSPSYNDSSGISDQAPKE